MTWMTLSRCSLSDDADQPRRSALHADWPAQLIRKLTMGMKKRMNKGKKWRCIMANGLVVRKSRVHIYICLMVGSIIGNLHSKSVDKGMAKLHGRQGL